MQAYKRYPKDLQDAMLRILKDETLWMFDALPLKRWSNGHNLELAMLRSRLSGDALTIEHRCMFEKANPETKTTTYATYDALLLDNWVVD